MVKMKAQLKIQQTAFMLVAITIFFVLVGMIVLVVSIGSIKESATNLKEEDARLLVSRLANSPEFTCGEVFGRYRSNCVDFDKLMALQKNIQKYRDFWGLENIEIRVIYPEIPGEILCNEGNYPDCNVLRLISKEINGTSVGNFISLCRKESYKDYTTDKCVVGKLMVSYKNV